MTNLLTAYKIDATNIIGSPTKIYLPRSVSDLKKIVADEPRFTIRGGGTSLVGGSVAFGEPVVDVSRMNKIRNADLEKEEIAVECGVILKDLNLTLKKRGYFFPVIPSSENSCTIGGMVATNAAGLRAVKYGRMIDRVRSLDVLLPSGKLKTVSGGDIADFCGTEGICGIVVMAVLGIARLPSMRTLSLYKFGDIKSLVEKVFELKKNENLSALEYVSRDLAHECGFERFYTLLVEFEDSCDGEIKDPAEIDRIIEKREGVGPVISKSGKFIYEDPWVPDERLEEFLVWCDNEKLPVFGHIGKNILHPCFGRGQAALIDEMFGKVKAFSGRITGEHGIGITKKKYVCEKGRCRFEKLKEKYDPDYKFNNGKIVGRDVDFGYSVPSGENKCITCGLCKGFCPFYNIDLSEVSSPRGLAFLRSQGIDADEFFNFCSACGACREVCPVKYKIEIHKARERMVDKGLETKANKKMIENVRKYGNPFGDLKGERPKDLYCC